MDSKWVQKPRIEHFSKLVNELKDGTSKCYDTFAGMIYSDFKHLLEKVTPLLKKGKGDFTITPEEQLILTLRFLASGDSYETLSKTFELPMSEIERIIPECCAAIFEALKNPYLKPATNRTDWEEIAAEFEHMWNFPHVVGAIDGRHILIDPPGDYNDRYYNYKGSHSIVLLALTDARYKFTYIDVGCNGRLSDSVVFENCSLAEDLENGSLKLPAPKPITMGHKPIQYTIIADNTFAMKPYLLKPYSARNQPEKNRVFNYRLSRARRVIDNTFGLLGNRFRILRQVLKVTPRKAKDIVCAVCVLHNYLLCTKSHERYAPNGTFDWEVDGEVHHGDWRKDEMPDDVLFPIERSHIDHSVKESDDIRDEFKEYFDSQRGEVHWQYKFI